MKTSLLRLCPLFVLLLGVFAPLPAALPPQREPFVGEVVRLQEIGRVVQIDRSEKPQWRRVTVMAKVMEVRRGRLQAGDSILVDYSVDLRARETPPVYPETRPGYEPYLDEKHAFWASLKKSDGTMANGWSEPRMTVFYAENQVTGEVYVPYSFDRL